MLQRVGLGWSAATQPISPSLFTGAEDLSTPLGVFRGQLLRQLEGLLFPGTDEVCIICRIYKLPNKVCVVLQFSIGTIRIFCCSFSLLQLTSMGRGGNANALRRSFNGRAACALPCSLKRPIMGCANQLKLD